jgi:tRNA/tmRNA/rRNA uracil-C5-methylase (TrmA/RlmC/RlmD family)
VEVTLLRPAAGGSCVAHADGATWFVRGGLPGEVVRARRTGAVKGGRVVFAEVVEVVDASPDRVVPPCRWVGLCGGCDLQHVAPAAQLRWKADVLRDQLARIGRLAHIGGVPLADAVRVLAVDMAGRAPGEGWRTRVAVTADDEGRACFHGRRSDDLVPVDHCVVAVPELQAGFVSRWPAQHRLHWSAGVDSVAAMVEGGRSADLAGSLPLGWRGTETTVRQAAGRSWRVATDGFWQAHVQAADLLADAVLELAAPQPGEVAVDLYSGVGLFAGVLADAVGPLGRVDAVEGDERAARLARRNLHGDGAVLLHHAEVSRWVGSGSGRDRVAAADVVVADPPRAGAGREVVAALTGSSARAVCYVACDPASLARDARQFGEAGWSLDRLVAYDLFAMSSHVEVVARFVPGGR